MNRIFTGVFSGLLLAPAALAEPPAVLRDHVLTISGGAVIDEDQGSVYYRNIELVEDENGRFQVTAAELAELATVDTVEAVVGEDEVEVMVEGTKSACVEILEPAVSISDDVFIAVLPESEPTSDVCILILESYQFTFPLDVSELDPDVYTVVVNDVAAEFTLEE